LLPHDCRYFTCVVQYTSQQPANHPGFQPLFPEMNNGPVLAEANDLRTLPYSAPASMERR
jgi:hypothetical protein